MEKKYILVPTLIMGLLAAGLIIHQTYQPEKQQQEVPATIQITTGADTGASTDVYGLLAWWQAAYDDGSSSSREYHLNKSKPTTNIAEECGNCHMGPWDENGTIKKHGPPFHPLTQRNSETGEIELGFNRSDVDKTGSWGFVATLLRIRII